MVFKHYLYLVYVILDKILYNFILVQYEIRIDFATDEYIGLVTDRVEGYGLSLGFGNLCAMILPGMMR
jgi:hypothetical protein